MMIPFLVRVAGTGTSTDLILKDCSLLPVTVWGLKAYFKGLPMVYLHWKFTTMRSIWLRVNVLSQPARAGVSHQQAEEARKEQRLEKKIWGR